MSTPHKEKLIRVLQLFQTTDEKTPMNAVQVSQKLEEEYGMENVHRTSIYDDVRLLQSCGYPIKQAENSHKGWYMEKYLLEDWEIKADVRFGATGKVCPFMKRMRFEISC